MVVERLKRAILARAASRGNGAMLLPEAFDGGVLGVHGELGALTGVPGAVDGVPGGDIRAGVAA